MQNFLRTVVGMLAGAALVILIMIAAGVQAQDGAQTLAGDAAPAQTAIADGVLAASTSMQYQGVLLDPVTGQPKPNGTYSMAFRLYTVAQGGTAIWTESQSVPVATGMFSVLLGSIIPLQGSYFNGQDLWLGVTVGSDAEMFPRQPLARVPYAFQALTANTANAANTANTATAAGTATTANSTTNLCSGDGSVCKDYRNTVFAYGIIGSAGNTINAFHLGNSALINNTDYKFRLKSSANTDVDYDQTRHVITITPYCNDLVQTSPMVYKDANDPAYVYVRLVGPNNSARLCAFNVSALYVQP